FVTMCVKQAHLVHSIEYYPIGGHSTRFQLLVAQQSYDARVFSFGFSPMTVHPEPIALCPEKPV
ncbi:MAG TPA: hypothetical protein VK638_44920, partial [Edaphobacter sp.]|nr:hypothetical protein [Edaphobacter sp.]